MRSLPSLIQVIHIWNSLIGVILFALLLAVTSKVKYFVSSGAEIAGYGNFQTFAYPATFVYMFIPTITATIYSIILSFDPSPKYKAWSPSRTMQGSIFFFAAALFLAALLPAIPGADVMTDGSALECLWTNYMQWKVQFNNPEVFPWVMAIDDACSMLKASDALCWILFIGWLAQVINYVRSASLAKNYLKHNK
ncbi:hypothetical protein RMATCC62417_03085 [Rhizopus microsporus]|nr:hypothetical protein RMATCC62417_03085 [Rhizopus microsporus]